MRNQFHHRSASLLGLVALVLVVFAPGTAFAQAAAPAKTALPTVVVLATGGTIAGAAGSDVQAAYTSGQVGVQQPRPRSSPC
jgi:L-asparaginase/Glu-tRNA(Gln) amidotransferase subunit D